MEASGAFSSALRLADLDDFIAPSQACVLPSAPAPARAPAPAPDRAAASTVAPAAAPVRVSVSLADCLACAGCITTAESVLVRSQSTDEFLAGIARTRDDDDGGRGGGVAVLSLSAASRAALAAHFGCDDLVEAHERLVGFFASLGVQHVLDVSAFRDLCLLATGDEFVARYRAASAASAAAVSAAASSSSSSSSGTDAPPASASASASSAAAPVLPLLCASCPGFVCYAEKMHGEWILPHLCTVRSPQQVAGAYVKRVLAAQLGVSPARVFHACVMPCFDKKLEAVREDFADADHAYRDVDCVISTAEVLELMSARGVEWASLERLRGHPDLTNISYAAGGGGGGGSTSAFGSPGPSGGFADFVFRAAARELFGVELAGPLDWQPVRRGSRDFQQVVLEVDGRIALRFAIANGFRNIANLMRRLKTGSARARLDFVEVMACPSGCVNGGGQIRAAAHENPRDLLERVVRVYSTQTDMVPGPGSGRALPAGRLGALAREALHTEYHAREKVVQNPLAIKW